MPTRFSHGWGAMECMGGQHNLTSHGRGEELAACGESSQVSSLLVLDSLQEGCLVELGGAFCRLMPVADNL